MERFIREIRRGTKVRGQAEGLSCPQVSQRGGGVQAPLPGSRASARILCRRSKKGGGRRGCFAKRTSCGSKGSRRRGRRWRRCFRSGVPPVHKRLHIHLDTTCASWGSMRYSGQVCIFVAKEERPGGDAPGADQPRPPGPGKAGGQGASTGITPRRPCTPGGGPGCRPGPRSGSTGSKGT
jgi:hypothetical protein